MVIGPRPPPEGDFRGKRSLPNACPQYRSSNSIVSGAINQSAGKDFFDLSVDLADRQRHLPLVLDDIDPQAMRYPIIAEIFEPMHDEHITGQFGKIGDRRIDPVQYFGIGRLWPTGRP